MSCNPTYVELLARPFDANLNHVGEPAVPCCLEEFYMLAV